MHMFRQSLKAVALMFAISLGGVALGAGRDMNVDANDVAIHGYDPVAYFIKSQPIEGSSRFTATHKNAIYQFSTAENRDMFRADPARYAPRFGGYCAMGVALNKKLDGDPNAWKIHNGKLYLNVNKDVQAKWSQDIPGNLKTANGAWPKIKDKKPEDL